MKSSLSTFILCILGRIVSSRGGGASMHGRGSKALAACTAGATRTAATRCVRCDSNGDDACRIGEDRGLLGEDTAMTALSLVIVAVLSWCGRDGCEK